MKSAAEMAEGMEWRQRPRARVLAGVARQEGMLAAADEVEALLFSLITTDGDCAVGNALMSWVKATREAAET